MADPATRSDGTVATWRGYIVTGDDDPLILDWLDRLDAAREQWLPLRGSGTPEEVRAHVTYLQAMGTLDDLVLPKAPRRDEGAYGGQGSGPDGAFVPGDWAKPLAPEETFVASNWVEPAVPDEDPDAVVVTAGYDRAEPQASAAVANAVDWSATGQAATTAPEPGFLATIGPDGQLAWRGRVFSDADDPAMVEAAQRAMRLERELAVADPRDTYLLESQFRTDRNILDERYDFLDPELPDYGFEEMPYQVPQSYIDRLVEMDTDLWYKERAGVQGLDTTFRDSFRASLINYGMTGEPIRSPAERVGDWIVALPGQVLGGIGDMVQALPQTLATVGQAAWDYALSIPEDMWNAVKLPYDLVTGQLPTDPVELAFRLADFLDLFPGGGKYAHDIAEAVLGVFGVARKAGRVADEPLDAGTVVANGRSISDVPGSSSPQSGRQPVVTGNAGLERADVVGEPTPPAALGPPLQASAGPGGTAPYKSWPQPPWEPVEFTVERPDAAHLPFGERLLADTDGVPFGNAKYIVGRLYAHGPNFGLNNVQRDDLISLIHGKPWELQPNGFYTWHRWRTPPNGAMLPQRDANGSLIFDSNGRIQTDPTVNVNVPEEHRDTIVGHEGLGHGIEHRIGTELTGLFYTVPLPPQVRSELNEIYKVMNHVDNGPQDRGYRGIAVGQELIADGISLLLHDPEYFKQVAPESTRMLRVLIREHPQLSQWLRISSLPTDGGAYLSETWNTRFG